MDVSGLAVYLTHHASIKHSNGPIPLSKNNMSVTEEIDGVLIVGVLLLGNDSVREWMKK